MPRAALIKRALAVDSLPIEADGEKVSFPWFAGSRTASRWKPTPISYRHLRHGKRNQKRITATEKSLDNEKYAFRCFLLRLGFIGAEYKGERKILLEEPLRQLGIQKRRKEGGGQQ